MAKFTMITSTDQYQRFLLFKKISLVHNERCEKSPLLDC